MFHPADSLYGGDSRPGSRAQSTISMTGSTRHILAPSHDQDHLGPPSPMYATRAGSPAPSSHSLTVNYLPSKFSNSLVSRRRGKDAKGMQGMMPRGGGVDAFRSNASRMPGKGDEDYDGVDVSSGGRLGGKARWTRFKVILFVANIVLSCYSLCALVFSLLTYFHTLKNARILLVANTSELALSTLAAAFALFVSLIGYPGILLNNRPFLAVYTFLLWIAFGLLVVPGYITYKRRTLNLEAKVNQQWSQELGAAGRLTIQSVLGCCGYFSPFVEATVSATCYSRSILPGCKQQFLEFQEKALTRWYIVSFGLVPVHIAIMAAGLLCSNHVTYRFGKGMMPKAYRLSREAMAVIMEQYASQLADQYGADAAAHMIANNSGNTGPRAQTHTRGTGSGLSGLGSGSGSGSGGYAQMPPNPFSPNPTPAASASDLNLAGPRPHGDEEGDEEGDGYSYGYGGVEEGDERGAGGQHAKYESLDIGAGRGF